MSGRSTETSKPRKWRAVVGKWGKERKERLSSSAAVAEGKLQTVLQITREVEVAWPVFGALSQFSQQNYKGCDRPG